MPATLLDSLHTGAGGKQPHILQTFHIHNSEPDGDVLNDKVPDIRQDNDFECLTMAAMAAAQTFGKGPADKGAWRKWALHPTKAASTLPPRIIEYLKEIGLNAEGKDGMTIDDLAEAAGKGWPVICTIQEYDIPGKPTSYKYGHGVIAIGVLSIGEGYVIVQDPSADNVLEGEGSDAAPGRMMIRNKDWLKNWHAEIGGVEYHNYGITVSPR